MTDRQQLYEGDGLEFDFALLKQGKKPGFYFTCCDCGLVHDCVFALSGRTGHEKVQLYFYRDNRDDGGGESGSGK